MTELWINGKRADIGKDTVFSFNSTNTDFSNPAAVKGTYSKTVELPDTERNRLIFNGCSDPSVVYTDFNPKKRTPFLLTSDGRSMQGYARLDSVRKSKGTVTYRLTLMAEEGDFFYNISFDENGGRRTFAGMWWHFTDADGCVMPREKEDTSIILNWNAKYITESWENLYSYDPSAFPRDQKGVITAAPVYGGYADDMDSDKVLIDTDSLYASEHGDTLEMLSGATRYRTWVLTKGVRDYTERETRDYKSWHQRPAVRCSALFDVIADPENNGGYTLRISDRIKESPYYKDTWLILNSPDLDRNSSEGEVPFTMETMRNDTWTKTEKVLASGIDTTSWDSPECEASFTLSIRLNRNVDNLYTSYLYDEDDPNYGGMTVRLRFDTPDGTSYSGVRLISSKVGDSSESGAGWGYHMPDVYHRLAQEIGCSEDEITVEEREFKIQNYEFGGEGSFATFENPVTIVSEIPSSTALTVTVEMMYVNVNKRGMRRPLATRTGRMVYTLLSSEWDLGLYAGGTNGAYPSVPPNLQKTGLTKKALFSDAMTPYEFITGFARILNLRFVAENGTVTLMTKDEYYTGEVCDLTEKYDTSQDINCEPVPWRTKWISFDTPHAETLASDTYASMEDRPYASLTLDTGYNYSNETKNALDGVRFTSAIPYRLKSPWIGGEGLQMPVTLNSPTYTVTVGDSEEVRPGLMIRGLSPEEYDSHPKLCLFDKDYKGVKATGVLAFFNHYQPLDGWMTDALRACQEINGNQCHVYCFGAGYRSIRDEEPTQVAWQFTRIPCFSKYLQDPDTGVYTHSLDFAKPELTFLGDADRYPSSIALYDRFWSKYCSDLYADSQFRVTMRAFVNGSVSEVMRRFYHFGGCLWTVASLSDYRFGSELPQQISFIKVGDTTAYTDNPPYWGQMAYARRAFAPVIPDTPDTPDIPSDGYLTLTGLEDCSYSFTDPIGYDDLECSYSVDGNVWTRLSSGESTPAYPAGTAVYFKRESSPYRISFRSTGRFDASGNAMSMAYGDSFSGMTSAPRESMEGLFAGCANLVRADRLSLPATTLSPHCYQDMFSNCTSLTAAPVLPATTLAEGCYFSMFAGCTSLTESPVLRAPVLETDCYYQMFMNCTGLTKITMLATDISATYCMRNWVYGLPSQGVFVKSGSAVIPTATEDNGYKGIPTGWTIEDA